MSTNTSTENVGNKPAAYIAVASKIKAKFLCCISMNETSNEDMNNIKNNSNEKGRKDKKEVQNVRSKSDLSVELSKIDEEEEKEINNTNK